MHVFDASVVIINIYSGFCQFKNQRDLIYLVPSSMVVVWKIDSRISHFTEKKCSVKKEVIQDSMKESSLIPFACKYIAAQCFM